jgi:hypothetical protein
VLLHNLGVQWHSRRLGAMTTSARVATDALTLALLNLAARGERTHCSDPGTSELWISDRSRDAPESAQAA